MLVRVEQKTKSSSSEPACLLAGGAGAGRIYISIQKRRKERSTGTLYIDTTHAWFGVVREEQQILWEMCRGDVAATVKTRRGGWVGGWLATPPPVSSLPRALWHGTTQRQTPPHREAGHSNGHGRRQIVRYGVVASAPSPLRTAAADRNPFVLTSVRGRPTSAAQCSHRSLSDHHCLLRPRLPSACCIY